MTATATSSATEARVSVSDRAIRYLKAGSGAPLVVLHQSSGSLGMTPALESLSKSATVYLFDMPGYGQSERPEWAREPRDIAVLMNAALEGLGLDKVHLLGLGFGGFIAAEMATMDPSRLRSLILVGAAGLKPREGEIMDEMLMDHTEFIERGFRSKESFEAFFGGQPDKSVKELWDFSREMTARISWKPFMFSNKLPHHLKNVATPSLLIWGSADEAVPTVCAQQYHEVLSNSRVELVAGAGHFVEYEEPEKFAALVSGFIAGK
ncbi:MAG: alpha/beta fold hydrolase [Dehalococcoidia bacterium]